MNQQQVDLQHEVEQLGYNASLAFDRHEHDVIDGTRLDQISQSYAYCARLLRYLDRAYIVEALRANARNARAAQGPGESDSDNARWIIMDMVHSDVADRLEAI